MFNMRKILFPLLVVTLISVLSTSCKKHKVCAAYSSFFMLEEDQRMAFFTPFGEDSTPKENAVEFNKNGLVAIRKSDKSDRLDKHYVKDLEALNPDLSYKPRKDSVVTDADGNINEADEYLNNLNGTEIDGNTNSLDEQIRQEQQEEYNYQEEEDEELLEEEEELLEEEFNESSDDEFVEDTTGF